MPEDITDLDVDIFGKTKLVDETEETGGTAFKVVLFEDYDLYIRLNGYYNSYESYAVFEEHDYDVVTPYQAVVTLFRSEEEEENKNI